MSWIAQSWLSLPLHSHKLNDRFLCTAHTHLSARRGRSPPLSIVPRDERKDGVRELFAVEQFTPQAALILYKPVSRGDTRDDAISVALSSSHLDPPCCSIKQLTRLINENCPSAVKEGAISDLNGRKIAIDASMVRPSDKLLSFRVRQ